MIKSCPKRVLDISQVNYYDLYIVTDYKVPYEADPQRFLPQEEERKRFHNQLLSEMNKRQFPFEIISGDLPNRIEQCTKLIEEKFNIKPPINNKRG